MFNSLFSVLALAVVSVSAFKSPSHSARSVQDHARRTPGQVVTSCTVPNTAALTFDDGPWVYLYDISKTLVAAGAKGTFFFNGNNWGCIYDEDEAKRVKYAIDKGHQVASHTWSHSNLTTLNWDQIHHEMWLSEEAIYKITGSYPAYVRPPYGSYNNLVVEAARVRGQTVVLWDFDSQDWALQAPAVQQLYTDLAKRRPKSVLTLNHEVKQQTAQVILPHIIKVLQQAGYKLVTLAECLGQPAYTTVGKPATRDASWTCVNR